MKYLIAGLSALAASCLITTPGHATVAGEVCNYRIALTTGPGCRLIPPGSVACLSISASIGPCVDLVKCFGNLGGFCSATLIPISGPEAQCASGSRRPSAAGLKCHAPGRLLGTRTPTPGGATPTFTDTPVPTATSTPIPPPTFTATAIPSATATSPPAPATSTATAAQPTATNTGTPTGTVAAATSTATAAQPTATSTGTPTGTVAAATSTATPPSTATATAVSQATGTNTVAAATATSTAVATSTNTGVAATATNTAPVATSTNTAVATATNTAAVATGTNTPVATATSTAVPPNTATRTNTPVNTATNTLPPSTSTATATATRTATATATLTAAPACPLLPGAYTLTQTSGGQLQVASIDGGTPGGFPFPAGGQVIQDVAAGTSPACVHSTIVPFPGGFSAPVFCIPGLNFTVQVAQSGCGVGQIDSNGGSDYTVLEVGDTSDNSATCNLPNPGCPPGPPSTSMRDTSQRVDITVGNAMADTCAGGGTANAVVAIPVQTTTWLPSSFTCPDADGMFNPGTDTLVLQVPQVLDFTTDTSTARWEDIDGDGCSISGAGPAAGFNRTGICIDLGTNTVTTAATGTIGSNGSPLFDITFATRLPNTISGPAAPLGASCASPPVINFTGSATRCIQ